MNKDDFIDLALKRDELDAKIKSLSTKKSKLDAKLLKWMETKEVDAIDHDGIRVMRIQGSRPVYDFDGLKKKLTTSQIKLVTTLSLNTTKLLQAITDGDVDQGLVEKYTEIKDSSPYIKISEIEE